MGDTDGAALALQLLGILEESGWIADASKSAVGDRNSGLSLVVKSHLEVPPYAVALLDAFTVSGFPLPGREDSSIDEKNTVEIVVGPKAR
jgi:hypothetical protein